MTFGLVETVDGLGQSIVVAVAHAAHRRLDTGFGRTLGVFYRDILGSLGRCDARARRDGGVAGSCRACSSASSTKPACAVRDALQPTILGAYA